MRCRHSKVRDNGERRPGYWQFPIPQKIQKVEWPCTHGWDLDRRKAITKTRVTMGKLERSIVLTETRKMAAQKIFSAVNLLD